MEIPHKIGNEFVNYNPRCTYCPLVPKRDTFYATDGTPLIINMLMDYIYTYIVTENFWISCSTQKSIDFIKKWSMFYNIWVLVITQWVICYAHAAVFPILKFISNISLPYSILLMPQNFQNLIHNTNTGYCTQMWMSQIIKYIGRI